MVQAHERADKGLRELMEVAVDQYCRVKFDECIQIADDTSSDWRRRVTNGGQEVDEVDGAVIARSKVMIDTRLKALAKIRPEKYGDPKKGPAVAVGVQVGMTRPDGVPVQNVSDLELARRLASVLERGKRAALAAQTPITVSATVQGVSSRAAIENPVASDEDDDVL
jgi:hypothetical protein